MKNKVKVLSLLSLLIAPVSIITPIVLVSCSNQASNDIPESTRYEKKFSVYLDPKEKYDAITLSPGVEPFRVSGINTNGQILAFIDKDKTSPTYLGWYWLLREIETNRIIASFCGWSNYAYLNCKEEINQNYTIPSTIALPEEVESIRGLKDRDIPVEAIGYSELLSGYQKFQEQYGRQSFISTFLFQYIETNPDGVYNNNFLFFPKRLNLCDSQIKYVFERATFDGRDDSYGSNVFTFLNPEIIFPKTLKYIGLTGKKFPIYYDGKKYVNKINHEYSCITLDFSKTSIIELPDIRLDNVNAIIKLPSSCKILNRIISVTDEENFSNFPNPKIKINLENVLKFSSAALCWWSFPDNTVLINKNAKYVRKEDIKPNHTSNLYPSFPSNVKIEKTK